ncbi:MAG: TonB-dependent siderophore receptor [Rhodospirillum sp.]|nr:TonB-dependent siderophore receptor [Rhodospirillum sp.]MCF8490222.1 TonB-dependent siderophore receptor [Rhodospirillum sp.]
MRKISKRALRRTTFIGSLCLSLSIGLPGAQAAILDIQSQPLGQALVALGRQANVQVLFDQDQVKNRMAPRLEGEMSLSEALARLLGGTGLSYEIDGNQVVLTVPGSTNGAQELPPVSVSGTQEQGSGPVQGYVAHRTATGSKTDTPLVEVPQSISVITPEQMEDRNVQEESEALLYTAGVVAQPFGGKADIFNNFYRIRGFASSYGGSYVDGLVKPVNYRFEPFGFERIEVLKGPTSVLYGQADPGGMVNRATKVARPGMTNSVNLELGNFDHKEFSFDIGGSVDSEDQLSLRMVGLVRDADQQVDFQEDQDLENDRIFLAPSATIQFNPDTKLTLMGHFMDDDIDRPISYISEGYNVTDIRLDQDAGTYYDYRDYSLGYAFEHHIDDSLTFNQNVSMSDMEFSYQGMFQSNGITSALADGHTVRRSVSGFEEWRRDYAVDTRLTKTFSWGPTDHTVLAGVDYQYLRDKYGFIWTTGPTLDLLDLDYDQTFADADAYLINESTTHNTGIYLQEQLKLYDNWLFTLGVRQDWSRTKVRDVLEGGKSSQSDSATSFRAGVSYIFENGIVPYFSYAESFLPTTGSDVSGTLFEPTTGVQYEVGVKYEPDMFPGMFTLAFFDLTKQNVVTSDPVNTGFSVQTGEIHSQGIELEATAEILHNLKLTGAYTFTKAEVTKSNSGNEGDEPALTPRHMASLWADYTLPASLIDGLSLGGGVRYMGETWAWDATTALPDRRKNDPYVLFDAAIRYDLGKALPAMDGASLALNATNILGTDYQVCYSRFDCQSGTPRVVMGTLKYTW